MDSYYNFSFTYILFKDYIFSSLMIEMDGRGQGKPFLPPTTSLNKSFGIVGKPSKSNFLSDPTTKKRRKK